MHRQLLIPIRNFAIYSLFNRKHTHSNIRQDLSSHSLMFSLPLVCLSSESDVDVCVYAHFDELYPLICHRKKKFNLLCAECVVRLHFESVCESVLCIDADFCVCNCIGGASKRYCLHSLRVKSKICWNTQVIMPVCIAYGEVGLFRMHFIVRRNTYKHIRELCAYSFLKI